MHVAVAPAATLPRAGIPFGGMPLEISVRAAAPVGSVRMLAKDEEIFAEGDRAAFFYKVISGAVRTSKLLSDGRRQIDAFHLAQLSQLERLTGIFWGFADENGSLFKGWLLEIACSEDQAPFQGRGLA